MKQTVYILLSLILLHSCATSKKLKRLSVEQIAAQVALSQESALPTLEATDTAKKEEIKVVPVEFESLLGDRIIVNAVKDEQTGEMIMSETLNSIVVEAKFRNIAERNGYVDIAFDIIVPSSMQDPSWQIEFQPKFHILKDTMNLDKILMTGEKYRTAQMRGYDLYNKFLSSIIPDTADFVHNYTYLNLLETFIARNIPRIAKLKNDTTIVADIDTCGIFGVSERQAIEHYTKQYLVDRNNRRKLKKDKMYRKYIKVPILKDGIRLDTVIHNTDGTVTYNYIQTIQAKKDLRKVDMVLDGRVLAEGKSIYAMPQTAPLTFYISSMSALADNTPRYLKKVIYRNATANTAAYIDFKAGRYNIDDTLSNNTTEIGRIKNNIRQVLQSKDYIVDSLIITASCSPEGTYKSNTILANNRAKAVKEYFGNFIRHYKDSVKNSIWDINLTDEQTDEPQDKNIEILTASIPEEWDRLQLLINNDTTVSEKEKIAQIFTIKDADSREKALQTNKDYRYIRSVLYPLLRTVKFDFYLHRKGMIKDTVHTTELDEKYMSGLRALEERNYKEAATILYEYSDYNTAVAFVCMDYNNSALQILETLPRSAKRDYMRAVVYSRLDNAEQAVEAFIHAVEQDYSMRHRGNLDPEISALIKKYDINNLLDNI